VGLFLWNSKSIHIRHSIITISDLPIDRDACAYKLLREDPGFAGIFF
jgi:hypothetical protein